MILREPATALDPRVQTKWLVENLLLTGFGAALVVGGLLLAGLALVAWPARLGVRAWRSRRPPVVEEETPSLSPLERALLLVEGTSESDGDERRAALEVLAGELDGAGVESLSGQATELAWSRSAPTDDAVSALLERVREEDGVPARA